MIKNRFSRHFLMTFDKNCIYIHYMSLAIYASHITESRGRFHQENESKTRSCFQRDRDRILHSTAFRRLIHKTQVLVAHAGDCYRTRLTHSLEVAQIARSLAQNLNLNQDLSETIALCHDFGHTPFGHAGEDALNESMKNHGGFDHNAQSLRIVTSLEKHYIGFDGLNLTWETLEGLVKHNGSVINSDVDKQDIPFAIAEFNNQYDLELSSFASAEAQVAAFADDVAYNNHDIDDGLRVGLFSLEDLTKLPMIGDIIRKIKTQHPTIETSRLRHEMIRRMIGNMVDDITTESKKRLQQYNPESVVHIRNLGKPVIGFSKEMEEIHQSLKIFLKKHMYRHYKVNRSVSKAKRIVSDLFTLFYNEPHLLPEEWFKPCFEAKKRKKDNELARVICDYIAGMTDRFAMEEHNNLFNLSKTSMV